jgi:predicted permease
MPEWKKEIADRIMNLKLEPTREAGIVEELAQHLEDRYAELLAGGATDEQASRLVLVELSDNEWLVRELRRVERQIKHEPVVLGEGRSNMFGDLLLDLRYGLRVLRKSPGFTAVAVLSLALGIGANTAIFSVLDALVLKPLPVSHPEQLVLIKRAEETVRSSNWLYKPFFESYRDLSEAFSGVSAVREIDRFNVMIDGPGGGLDTAKVRIGLVSGNYFSTLGVNAAVGRTLTADDDRVPGGHPVAVISYAYWKRTFALAPDVLQRTLNINGTTYTILGVTAPGFSGDWVGQLTDVWIPVSMYAQVMSDPGGLNNAIVRVLARLKPGVTREQAQAAAQVADYNALASIPGVTPEQVHRNGDDIPITLEPAAKGYSPQRKSFAQPVIVMMILVGLVLLIACANVANLLLARSAARQREMALRRALGAGRMRIVRQLLTESILLAILAAALGLAFAVWGKNVIVTFMASGHVVGRSSEILSINLDLNTDPRLLGFTAAVCVLTGILFGIAPAFRASNVSLSSALTEHSAGRGSSGPRGGSGRLLVIAQVALLLILLVGAGLFARTLRNLRAQELGFDREHLLQVWTAPWQSVSTGPAMVSIFQKAQEQISSLPGVLSASVSTRGLLNGLEGNTGSSDALRIEGQPPKPGQRLGRSVIAPGFFDTVGMPMLEGRDFTDQDTATSQSVAIVNESMAQFYFGDQSPIGRRFGYGADVDYPRQIVGVVKDAKYDTAREKTPLMLYLPYRQAARFLGDLCVVVRTAGNPATVSASIRQELRDIDPSLPVLKINTIEEQLDDALVQERTVAALAGFLGVLAVLLACLGLYGMISYTVARRTNEIGIRVALGATRSDIIGMVLKESLLLVLVGVAIGIPATLGTTRLVSAMLFGISAADPLTIAAATLLMIVVAALASLMPAHRASRVDPMVALRYE